MRKMYMTTTTRGGKILGRGQNNNVIFTADDLVSVYPGASHAVLESEFDVSVTKTIATVAKDDDKNGDTGDTGDKGEIVFKFVCSPYQMQEEIHANRVIRQVFSAAGLLHATIIHPLFDTASVVNGDRAIGKCVVYARQQGHLMTNKSNKTKKTKKHMDHGSASWFRTTVEVARAVLVFLSVLHRSGFLHLDVKPENILLSKKKKNATTTAFLGDYGTVSPMSYVADNIVKNGSLTLGTFGYMSPILLDSDDDNDVYGRVSRIAKLGPAALSPKTRRRKEKDRERRGSWEEDDDNDDEVLWDHHFETQRRLVLASGDLSKIDLHSLGFVLYDAVATHVSSSSSPSSHSPSGADSDDDNKNDLYRLTGFISRLIFDGPGSYRNADAALRGWLYYFGRRGDPVGTGKTESVTYDVRNDVRKALALS